MIKRISIVLGLLTVLALPALAAPEFSSNLLTVREYNTIQPLQNPDYERGEKILSRRVIDSKNKVVGKVDDVILAGNGSIESLKVDFDRLRLSTPVYINYRTLRINSVTRGYQLSFNDAEIAEIYPGLLADIATAAGGEGEDLSLSKLAGTQVAAADGRKIGKIGDVLFASSGNRADALYVDMSFGALRDKGVAIPFRSGTYSDDGLKTTLVIPDDLAEAMISFASQK